MVLDSMPPLDEVAKYNLAANRQDGGGGQGGLSSLMAALPADTALPKAKFNKGDKVRGPVYRGGTLCIRLSGAPDAWLARVGCVDMASRGSSCSCFPP